MGVTKVSSTQTKNEGLPKILKIVYNNGTGTRSSTTSTSFVTLPGATGDTSYTAPADQNVDILFTMTQMTLVTAGVCNIGLSINGVLQKPYTYQEPPSGSINWPVQTLVYKIPVDAGQTITIGAQWRATGGTATVTNDSDDQEYPNEIIGLVIPRPS